MFIETITNTCQLSKSDNVALAIRDIPKNSILTHTSEMALEKIPKGHKVAIARIKKGEPVIKYAQVIGFATKDIEIGEHVHVHNCQVDNFSRDYAYSSAIKNIKLSDEYKDRTFDGYIRSNGKVGTRNFIGIITSVNCSATAARLIADEIKSSGVLDNYPNVDGVVALVHGAGCCIKSDGEGYRNLQRTLGGYASHPNFAGVLMIGLGCEVMQIERLLKESNIDNSDFLKTIIIQQEGGIRKTVETGVNAIKEMLPAADQARRTPVSISHLTIALQCGGSDGYSGITANPALGVAADLLVGAGGTVALSETPEIYGAEHLLTARAATPEIGKKLVERIKWWEEYAAKNDGTMDNNPTPGNKAGGLTTIYEKSLGAIAKAGTSTLNGVYEYSEPIDTKGFVFVDGPGYDPCSITGQVASGCNMICFTTGRGSCFGYKPVPTVKLATNTSMYTHMEEDMDINCGDIITDNVSLGEKGREILEYVIAVASGKKSKSELNGLGDNEFVPWQLGAQM